ncbi:MAG: Holliday junction resolvase RuvX [Chitinivibrionales bacterium]|nr:Holliday junction resolvase RuvX [Chitinivibrionales bacterium]
MKLLGIDYGRRRIGLAITDELGLCVQGLATIDRQKRADVIDSLRKVIASSHPDKLVFGIPLDVNDCETVMSQEVRSFAAQVQQASNLPCEFVDESLSSQRADSILRHRSKKQRRDKANRDRIAACLILETYLQEHSAGS